VSGRGQAFLGEDDNYYLGGYPMRELCMMTFLLAMAASTSAVAQQQPIVVNSVGMPLVPIPQGQFAMGSPADRRESEADERLHSVQLTQPFFLGQTEVTQEQYQRIMGSNPSHFSAADGSKKDYPVENVTWEDAVEFCRRLTELPEEKKAGRQYRLPTEAEWEYACRAGSAADYSVADGKKLEDHGWFANNSGLRPLDATALWKEDQSNYMERILGNKGSTSRVGVKLPNAWGLHDMHGNVWEWCQDWYGAYPEQTVTDPQGPAEGTAKVARGGGWHNPAAFCRSAYRFRDDPAQRDYDIGIRVLMELVR
jgi:formylglycine-generating enzyme required for sulfatase activity